MKRAAMFLLAVCIGSRVTSAQSTIVGTVFDSLHSHAGLAHATVVIPELPRYTTTDSRGRFRFDSVPAGRFSITFLHATLDSLDMAAPTAPIVTQEKGTVNAALAIPSPGTVYAHFCPGPRDVTTGFLVGRVRDVDDASPLTHSTVTAAWTDFVFDHGKLQAQPMRVSSVSNAAGVYVLCGMPEDLSLEVFARSDDFVAGPVPVLLDSSLAQRVNLAVSRRDSAARSQEQPAAGAAATDTVPRVVDGSAAIAGTVWSDQNRPLPGATAALHGAAATARADSAGRFRLSHVPAGTRAIDMRSLGSAPATFTVDLKSGAELDTIIRLDHAQILRPVAVVEHGVTNDKTGFTERQRIGIGHFMDAADIDRLPTANVFSLLHRIPTIHQTQVGNTQLLRMRGGSVAKNLRFDNGQNLCLPTFFIDEQLVQLDDGPDPYKTIKWMAPVEDITGIEVYTPLERIPAWADRSWKDGCGSVIIWTKWAKRK